LSVDEGPAIELSAIKLIGYAQTFEREGRGSWNLQRGGTPVLIRDC
jgi:hypothetical protein